MRKRVLKPVIVLENSLFVLILTVTTAGENSYLTATTGEKTLNSSLDKSDSSEMITTGTVAVAPDEETVDVVYLKNGSIIKGQMGREIPGNSGTIETHEGNTLNLSPQDILATTKLDEVIQFQALKNEVMFELRVASMESRKIFDLAGLLFSYAATIGGYYTLGGEDLARIVVPVAGPFLLLEPPQRGTPHTPFPFRQLLLVGSGLVQAGFLADYVISGRRERNLRRKYHFGLHPSGKNLTVSVTVGLNL
ncbi:MAG: hypothetical protein V3U24_01465 [Candidatus Neomarinimicrobiota bacterium]